MTETEQKFTKIKEEYDKFSRELLKQGKLTVRDTEKGIWGITRCDEALNIFKKINLDKYKNFIDLGSGDGRAVIVASLFTNAVGVEFDKELNDKAIEINKKLKLKAKFICKDFFEINLKEYDVIFMNPDRGFEFGLEQKILKEFKGLLVVYNNIFLPNILKKKKVIWAEQVPVNIYEVK